MHERRSIARDIGTYITQADEGTYSFIEVDRPAPEVLEERRRAESRTTGRIAVICLVVMTAVGASAFIDWIREHPVTAASIVAIAVAIMFGAWRVIRSVS